MKFFFNFSFGYEGWNVFHIDRKYSLNIPKGKKKYKLKSFVSENTRSAGFFEYVYDKLEFKNSSS